MEMGLVDASSDALVALSTEGVVLAWNRTAEQLIGLAAASAIGRPLDELLDKRLEIDIEQLPRDVERYLATATSA